MGKRENVKEISENYLLKASDKIESAEILFNKGKFSDSISRLYYAVFLASKAILILIGEDPKTSSGLITIFGLKIVKTNLIDKKYAKILTNLFNARQESDYNPLTWFDEKDTREYLDDAKKFLKKMIELSEQLK